MSDVLLSYGVSTYISQNILIAPFQADFYVEVIQALQEEILNEIHEKPHIIGLIIDLSKINILDVHNMKDLEATLRMAEVLGVIGFLVGLKPNVTLALVNLGFEQEEIKTALNIEQAILSIQRLVKARNIEAVEETEEKRLDTNPGEEDIES